MIHTCIFVNPVPREQLQLINFQHAKIYPPRFMLNLLSNGVKAGASIIGGCCEIGPEQIDFLCRQLKANGHRLTTLPV